MKKETVNTFTGGMNKDLNPLVTPNDILTDALNAQMLTFNGDELSLQTDAGNTKIKVGNDFIKLSEGFYPLGIKEYGGVLYIVSGRSIENNLKSLEENSDYFLYDVIRFKGNYYYCNENTHIDSIPETLDSKWTSLGSDVNDARKAFDLVEFGSYPAPEFSDDQILHGIGAKLTHNNIYKNFVINNNFFKTGRRIRFTVGQNDELSNVDINDNPKKIYIVRLLHQLDNGILDLTDDVWRSFKEHKINTGDPANHWLTSTMFYYYCPTRFKGKLQLQVILDEPKYFRLVNNPILEDSDNIEYSNTLEFNLEWENSDNIQITSIEYRIKYSGIIDTSISQNGWIRIPENTSQYLPTTNKENSYNFTINIPYENTINFETHRSIEYEIIPKFSNNGIIINDSELPEEFKNKYKITGTKLLDQKYNEIYFNLVDGICKGNGYREYQRAILRNRDGNVGMDLEPSDTDYIYLRKDTDIVPENSEVVAYYTINDNKPVLEPLNNNQEELKQEMDSKHPGLFEHLKTMFENTSIQLQDSSCLNMTIKLRFNLEIPIESSNKLASGYSIIATQPSISREPLPIFSLDGRTFEIDITSSDDLKLNIYFEPLSFSIIRTIKKESFEDNKIYDFGIITKMSGNGWFINPENTPSKNSFSYDSITQWNKELGEHIFENNLFKVQKGSGVSKNLSVRYYPNTYTFAIYVNPAITYNEVVNGPDGNILIPFTVLGEELTGDYVNISNPSNYIKIGKDELGYVILTKNNNVRAYILQFPEGGSI